MFTTHPLARLLLHASLPLVLLAAWLVLAPSAASAQDAQSQSAEITKQIGQYVVDGVKRGAARDFDGATDLYRKAVELAEKNFGPEDMMTGWSLDYLGASYIEKGDYREAERHLTRSVKILDKLLKGIPEGDNPLDEYAKYVGLQLAKAVHDLAVAYDFLGEYSSAEIFYGRALAAREKFRGPDHPEVAESLNFLANVYLAKADYARAAQMFQRALAINEKIYGAEDPRVTTLMGNLAYAYEAQGDAAKAEELLKEAIVRAGKRPNPESRAMATYLNNLGTLYRVKRPAEARPLLDRALAMREKLFGPDDADVAVTLNNLGMLDWQEGALKEAAQRFQRSVEINRKSYGPAHPTVADTLSNLALLYLAMGETKRGIGLLSEGSKYSERNLLAKLTTGSEEQKRTYAASVEEGTSAMVTLYLRVAPGDEQAARLAMNTILWRKGRVLDVTSGQIAAAFGSADAESLAAHAKLTAARGQLSALSTLRLRGSGGDDAQYEAKADELKSQIQSLEKLISERAAAVGAGSDSVSTESVQAAIPADAALVEIIQYRPAPIGAASGGAWEAPRYAAVVLKRAGTPSAVDLGDAAKIDADVERLRKALSNRLSKNVRPLARALDEEVMRPARKLMGDEVKHVLISPDGALNLVPFAALVDEQDRHLVENYTFTYLASGRDLSRARSRAPSKQSPVVIANPLFGDAPAAEGPRPVGAASGLRASLTSTWPSLDATSDEAREVSAILRGASTLTGAQATEAAVKQVKAPSILHIATHGFFFNKAAPASGSRAQTADNPLLRSGLVLAGANKLDGGQGEDGILTALEAAALDLHGTRLIVLSACETGVGEVQSGEGVYGLRRALALAGAESQLISLWKVDDEATRDLMSGFYKKLMAGDGRSESLRQVQLKLLRSDEFSHPFFWAGFIMSGQWGPL
jgi:CHAT domain-containing protein/Tfp pilus assembly protein PilF